MVLTGDQAFAVLTAAGSIYAAKQLSAYWSVDHLKTLSNSSWLAIMWSLIGFSIAYGPAQASRVIGDATFATIDNFSNSPTTYSSFNISAAWVYTLSLVLMANAVVGSVATRMTWGNYLVFATLWTLGVYVPLTHWIFAQRGATFQWANTGAAAGPIPSGWLGGGIDGYGLQDFAAVHPIHIAGGVSALVLTYWMRHHESVEHAVNVWEFMPSLIFGWAAYICGSTGVYAQSIGSGVKPTGTIITGLLLGTYGNAATALVNSVLAAAGGAFTWGIMEWVVADAHLEVAGGWRKLFTGTPSATGSATGAMAGLVSISAAGGWVSPMWAIFFGFFTSMLVFFGPTLVSRYLPNFSWAAKQNYSAFMVHGFAGAIGSALTGLFANTSYQAGGYANTGSFGNNVQGYFNGSFYWNSAQLGKQCAGITITILVAVVATSVAYWATYWVGRLSFYPTQTGLQEGEEGDEKL